MKLFIEYFNNGFSNYMASSNLFEPLSRFCLRENIFDSNAPTKTWLICMNYLARVKRTFVECGPIYLIIYLLSLGVSITCSLARMKP